MTAATLTLADFLLARIAEDEAVARAAQKAPPSYGDEEGSFYGKGSTFDEFVSMSLNEGTSAEAGAHARRFDPARVLAECEAKRAIVEALVTERVRRDIYNRDYDSGEYELNRNDLRARLSSNAHCHGLEIAILALAAVYADHTDYRDEWRP